MKCRNGAANVIYKSRLSCIAALGRLGILVGSCMELYRTCVRSAVVCGDRTWCLLQNMMRNSARTSEILGQRFVLCVEYDEEFSKDQ